MMEMLFKRGQAVADAHAEAVADTLVEMLGEQLPPGISAERVTIGITLVGKGLRRRYITDTKLRHLRP
jgi:hypothetical protein